MRRRSFQNLLNLERAQEAGGNQFTRTHMGGTQQGTGLVAKDTNVIGVGPVATAAHPAQESAGIVVVQRHVEVVG
jgi:hypothetical protein